MGIPVAVFETAPTSALSELRALTWMLYVVPFTRGESVLESRVITIDVAVEAGLTDAHVAPPSVEY